MLVCEGDRDMFLDTPAPDLQRMWERKLRDEMISLRRDTRASVFHFLLIHLKIHLYRHTYETLS